MKLPPWRKLAEETRAVNPWWIYKCDAFELPSGSRGEYHYVATHGSAMVIPLLADGRILMVRQYRYLNGRESLEFAGGGVKQGATHEQTAAEELAQETGLRAGRLEPIGEFNPFNGVTNEICRVFVARDLSDGALPPDETEQIAAEPLEPRELEERIRRREVWDGMTLAAWSLYRTWSG